MINKVNAIQTNDTGNLVKNTDYITKVEDIEKKIPNNDKYIATNDFNKFSVAKFDERLKKSKLATNSPLNTIEQRANKNEEILEK